MPHQEPATTGDEPVLSPEQPVARAASESTALPYPTEPVDDGTQPPVDDEWLDEPEQLPRRPRRRLFGVGANPLAIGLLAVLLAAGGFVGGVLVEKGETSSSSSSPSGAAASLASRFRALREGTTSTTSTSGGSGASSSATSGFARPTAGTVSFLAGNTLYVTTAEGNTVKVNTSRATTVTKSVKATVNAIHPGETITVTGETDSNGAVSAESISVGSSAGAGALSALFGGGAGGSGSGRASSSGASGTGGGGQALFGSG
jgi:hypothetical protein